MKTNTNDLPKSGKHMVIIKDLSESKAEGKRDLFPDLASAVAGTNEGERIPSGGQDGQLVASWRDWAEQNGDKVFADFKALEGMLVEGRYYDQHLPLHLYNLSRIDASQHFDALVEQVVEHPQWRGREWLDEGGGYYLPYPTQSRVVSRRRS